MTVPADEQVIGARGARQEVETARPMEQKLGTVRVSPAVLATVVRLTATGVAGVARVGGRPLGPFGRVPWRRAKNSGVRLQVLPDGVHVEIDLVVQHGHNMLEVAGQVQHEISDAVEKMIGMTVREVNVRIQDVR